MASTKSLAQKIDDCFSSTQVHRLNEYRKSCEKCQLDLTDTLVALKDSREREAKSDHGVTVVVGFVALALGFIIGNANANAH